MILFHNNNTCADTGLPARPWLLATLLLLLVIAPETSVAAASKNPDPWEGFNRKVWGFNEFFDKYLGKPAARTWKFLTPAWLDDGVTRIFANNKDLTSGIHNVLQWEWRNAGHNLGRFSVNATLGIGGFFDVATDLKLRRTPEDMGLTFARWGIPSGPFLMLPLLGPSTVRDAAGEVPNEWLRPHHYIEHELTRHSVTAVYIVDLRAGLLDLEEGLSGDRYIFVRDFYLQSRLLASGQELPEDDFGAGLPVGSGMDSGMDSNADDGWGDDGADPRPLDETDDW